MIVASGVLALLGLALTSYGATSRSLSLVDRILVRTLAAFPMVSAVVIVLVAPGTITFG